jgi:CheY-like chemotaxis protein
MMGGEITLNSLEKKGTEIRVTLVLKRSLNVMQKMKPINRAENISVLFIDDNELNRKITVRMLEDEGIKVFAVENGKRGLEILGEENDINIILLDVNMPEMDGFTVAEEIKRRFGSRYIIVMFTSVDIRDNIEKIKQLGIYDYIVKPIKKTELINKIRDAVNTGEPPKNKEDESEKEETNQKKSGLSILVVEDNNVNLNTLIKMIQKCGDFKIYTANDGSEAVAMYEKKMTDYIFMDIQMPVMNGLDATTEIRGISELYKKKPKIIAITAYAMKNDKEKFLAYGMDAVIEKPFKIADIKKIFEI